MTELAVQVLNRLNFLQRLWHQQSVQTCTACAGSVLGSLHQPGAGQPALRSGHEPSWWCLPSPLPHVPLPHQLLHHRLVSPLARPGPAVCQHPDPSPAGPAQPPDQACPGQYVCPHPHQCGSGFRQNVCTAQTKVPTCFGCFELYNQEYLCQ